MGKGGGGGGERGEDEGVGRGEKWKLVCLFNLISEVTSIASATFYWSHKPPGSM